MGDVPKYPIERPGDKNGPSTWAYEPHSWKRDVCTFCSEERTDTYFGVGPEEEPEGGVIDACLECILAQGDIRAQEEESQLAWVRILHKRVVERYEQAREKIARNDGKLQDVVDTVLLHDVQFALEEMEELLIGVLTLAGRYTDDTATVGTEGA